MPVLLVSYIYYSPMLISQSLCLNFIEYLFFLCDLLHNVMSIYNYHRWFPEVQNIFYHGNKRKLIPLGQLDSFFHSVAVLMTNQLRELALDSIQEYKLVFCPPKVRP